MENILSTIKNFFNVNRIKELDVSESEKTVYFTGVSLFGFGFLVLISKILLFPILILSKIPMTLVLMFIILGYGIHIYITNTNKEKINTPEIIKESEEN